MRDKIKKEILAIILVIVVIIFWKHIPFLQFQGEGFTYFERDVAKFRSVYPPIHDNFARLFFLLAADVFKENVYLYMSFMFLYMILIDIILYLSVRKILDKKTAFMIAAFFSLSMIANYDIFSSGGYQYFVQRVSPLPLVLIAFVFLNTFLIKPQKKYYLISLFLYLFGIWLGFFSTWFLPAFIFLPLFFIIFSKDFKKNIFSFFWVPIPFVIGNLLIIRNSGYSSPEYSLFYLLTQRTEFVFNGFLEQLNVVTIPLELLKVIYFFLQKVANFSKERSILIMGFCTLIIYISATGIILTQKAKVKVIIFCALFTIMSMLIFNLYLNYSAALNVLGSSRYFYYPYIFVAIFWGIFLMTILNFRNFMIKLLGVVIFTIYILSNFFSLQNALKEDKWRHEANRETIEFLKVKKDLFQESPYYVYLPSSLGAYGNSYAFRYFSHPDGYFRLESLESIDYKMLADKKVDPGRLYFLHYDPAKQRIVDLTTESRAEYIKTLKKN